MFDIQNNCFLVPDSLEVFVGAISASQKDSLYSIPRLVLLVRCDLLGLS